MTDRKPLQFMQLTEEASSRLDAAAVTWGATKTIIIAVCLDRYMAAHADKPIKQASGSLITTQMTLPAPAVAQYEQLTAANPDVTRYSILSAVLVKELQPAKSDENLTPIPSTERTRVLRLPLAAKAALEALQGDWDTSATNAIALAVDRYQRAGKGRTEPAIIPYGAERVQVLVSLPIFTRATLEELAARYTVSTQVIAAAAIHFAMA